MKGNSSVLIKEGEYIYFLIQILWLFVKKGNKLFPVRVTSRENNFNCKVSLSLLVPTENWI